MSDRIESFRANAKVCRRLAAETEDEQMIKDLILVAEDLEQAAAEMEEQEAGER